MLSDLSAEGGECRDDVDGLGAGGVVGMDVDPSDDSRGIDDDNRGHRVPRYSTITAGLPARAASSVTETPCASISSASGSTSPGLVELDGAARSAMVRLMRTSMVTTVPAV